MTQTLTPRHESPDPDRRPDSDGPDPDPGPDDIQTRTLTLTDVQTQTRPGPESGSGRHPDPDSDPDPDRRPDPDPTDHPAQIETRSSGQGQGPDDTLTLTPDRRTLTESYPGGWLARRRARARARHLAEDEAIRRGTEVELRRLEDAAVADLADDADQPARWEKFAAGWPQWALTVVVSIMASVGQIQFAREHGATDMIQLFGHDVGPLLAPAVFDFSVAGLYAFGLFVAVRYKASPWLPWIAGSAIGAVSVFTNTQHRGALIFASSSAVLLVSWGVRLIVKYRHLPHVKAARAKKIATAKDRRATGKPRLLTSSLVLASRPTATRAWTIARRRPIAACAERMRDQGEKITERDLVIRAAELFISVDADRLVAELAVIGDPPAGREALKAWRVKRDQAHRRAALVAWDAVDNLLGIPVINRTGIKVNQISYLEPTPPPAPKARAIPGATAAAPAAPALPAATTAPIGAPAQRRRIAAASPAAVPAEDETVDEPTGEAAGELLQGQPVGNAGINWLPLSDLPGLPEIDPDRACACHFDPSKRCGRTLAEHVQRRGQQVRMILSKVPDWETGPKISKPVVRDVCNVGSSTQQEVAWLFHQLREIAAEQAWAFSSDADRQSRPAASRPARRTGWPSPSSDVLRHHVSEVPEA